MVTSVVRVLVVDDSVELLESIRENLELRGPFEVIMATNGKEAIERLQADFPHAVVLDFRLNGQSTGLDVLKEIRATDQFVPVVLYSGLADGEDKAQLIHENITFILEKGAPPAALPELLERVVHDRHEIVAGLARWAEGNSSADQPSLTLVNGATLTMNEALAEMKKCTPLGRKLLEQYRQGITEIFATSIAAASHSDDEEGGA